MSVQELKNKINWELIVSGLILAVLIGAAAYGLKASGFRTAAEIIKGGK